MTSYVIEKGNLNASKSILIIRITEIFKAVLDSMELINEVIWERVIEQRLRLESNYWRISLDLCLERQP